MMFEFADEVQRLTDIRVAGVGGAGGNAIGRMIQAGLVGVEFIAMNTDRQALEDCQAHNCMQIGSVLTHGLGSGGNPAVGQGAAEEDRAVIAKALEGANMVFVTAGMGGGTGTGAAPVVAEVAREMGALTVGIVTKPFLFEGRVRMAQAEAGIAKLREAVDTLIVVPNQRLLEIVPPSTTMQEAYRIADHVLYEATRGIFEIISRHDQMNLDFADVCSVMRGMGEAMMGTGRAAGENRALEAAKMAISSPLLEDIDIAGSQAVLVNVLGREVELHETATAMQFIQDAAGPEAHVIFGYGIDESLDDTLQITVIATGFQNSAANGRVARQTAVKTAMPVAALTEPEPEPVVVQPVVETPVVETPVMEQPVAQPIMAEAEIAECSEEPEFVEPPEELEEDPGWDPREEADFAEEMMIFAEEPEPATPVIEAPAAKLEAPAFLAREATAGGTDRKDAAAKFLQPVGLRNIGEVEVPEGRGGPVRLGRSEASGLGPDNPGDDRNTPAYIRKYMD